MGKAVVFLFCLISLWPWPVDAQATAEGTKHIGPPFVAKHPKISPDILHGVDLEAGRIRSEPPWAIGIRGLDINANGLQVYIELEEVRPRIQEMIEGLKAFGVTIEIVEPVAKLVQARIPLDRIERVSQLPFVKFIRLPDYGHLNCQGTACTPGDAVIRADVVRQHGFDGTGTRVGVVSDGIRGLSDSIMSGDLPAQGVGSRSCRADGNLDAGAEGTAILEIIRDLAPGATLFFANFATSLEFICAVNWLADEAGGPNPRRGMQGGVDIIVEDVAFFNVGPYDGSSSVSRALSDAVARGVAVFAAVGNHAQHHYQGLFTDTDGDTLHDFDVSLGQPRVDEAGETLNVTLQPGETIGIFLQWNDPFGASGNNYDLCVYDPPDLPTSPLFCSTRIQDGDDAPTEGLIITRTAPTPGTLGIAIINVQGRAAPGIFDVFILGGTTGEFIVPESSVPNVSDAAGVISVGAVNWQTPEMIEPFSSRGPTNDGRLKPDLVAPDGVSVTGHGGFPTPFFGTSAAVPHAGAVGALILSVNPTLTPSLLTSRMTSTAVPLGFPIPNNTFGFGRVDAVNAAPPRLVLSLNQPLFRPGETLRVGLRAQNPGGAVSVDFYFGLLLPDGVTVLFFNSLGGGVVTRLDADPRTFPPMLANATLPPGVEGTINDFFVYTFSGGEPPGVYIFFAILTPPGAFADGLVNGSDLLTLPVAPFNFSP